MNSRFEKNAIGKVEVLLSYYNGGEYFCDQLNSILTQDYSGKIIIRIRDDGSQNIKVDKNLEIMECPKNREIIVDRGANLGACRSFLALIQGADDADYYFFADQDDVWKSDKIRNAVERMSGKDDHCTMWCSDYTITNKDLEIVRECGVEIEKRTFHFLRAVFFNTFPGCVMAVNRKLLLLLKQMNLSNCMMHDSVIFATAIATGEVIYDDRPLIYHRIHGDNVIGYGRKKIILTRWVKEKVKLLIQKEDFDVSELGRKLLMLKDIQLKKDVCDDVMLLSDYKSSWIKTLKLRFHPDIKDGVNRCALSIHSKILLHLF